MSKANQNNLRPQSGCALLIATSVVSLLSGCQGNALVPININDSSTSFVSARAVWHPRTSPAGQTLGELSHGVEIQYIRTTGRDDQSLATGQVMSVGGTSVTGPRRISHRADISYAHLAYSATGSLQAYPAELDVFMGLGRVDYRLRSEVTTATPLMLQESQTDYALTMGMGLRWRLVKQAFAEGGIILFSQNPTSYPFGRFGGGKQTDMIEGELALVYKPVKRIALRGGYAWMSLTPEKTTDSPLEFKLRGPLVGLEVFF